MAILKAIAASRTLSNLSTAIASRTLSTGLPQPESRTIKIAMNDALSSWSIFIFALVHNVLCLKVVRLSKFAFVGCARVLIIAHAILAGQTSPISRIGKLRAGCGRTRGPAVVGGRAVCNIVYYFEFSWYNVYARLFEKRGIG